MLHQNNKKICSGKVIKVYDDKTIRISIRIKKYSYLLNVKISGLNNNIDKILLKKLLNDKKIKFESIKLVNNDYILGNIYIKKGYLCNKNYININNFFDNNEYLTQNYITSNL